MGWPVRIVFLGLAIALVATAIPLYLYITPSDSGFHARMQGLPLGMVALAVACLFASRGRWVRA